MQDLSAFLSRIQTDYEFYLQFQRNPQEAVAKYELSAEEKAALTQSEEELSLRLGRIMQFNSSAEATTQISIARLGSAGAGGFDGHAFETPTTQTSQVLLSGKVEFDTANALSRLEVRQTVAQIRSADTQVDRFVPVLALMGQIG
jgi:hypothetical protein